MSTKYENLILKTSGGILFYFLTMETVFTKMKCKIMQVKKALFSQYLFAV